MAARAARSPSRAGPKNILELWIGAVSKPTSTFAAEARQKRTLAQGAVHILIYAVIAAIITGASGNYVIYQTLLGLSPALGAGFWIALLVLVVALNFAFWLIWSGFIYAAARMLDGKGRYAMQSYLIAIYAAPLGIITSLAMLAGTLGFAINILIFIYSLYLLTAALRAAHGFSTGKAVIAWVIAVVILGVIAVVLIVLLVFALIAGGIAGGGAAARAAVLRPVQKQGIPAAA